MGDHQYALHLHTDLDRVQNLHVELGSDQFWLLNGYSILGKWETFRLSSCEVRCLSPPTESWESKLAPATFGGQKTMNWKSQIQEITSRPAPFVV